MIKCNTWVVWYSLVRLAASEVCLSEVFLCISLSKLQSSITTQSPSLILRWDEPDCLLSNILTYIPWGWQILVDDAAGIGHTEDALVLFRITSFQQDVTGKGWGHSQSQHSFSHSWLVPYDNPTSPYYFSSPPLYSQFFVVLYCTCTAFIIFLL